MSTKEDFKQSFIFILKIFVLFGAYVATARLGLELYSVNNFAALIWAPTGLALASLILYGIELWPAVLLGAFATNLAIGGTPAIALTIAIGNALEALVATYILQEYVHFSPMLSKARDSLGYVVVVIGATLVSATIGVSALYLGNMLPFEAVQDTWIAWWVGDLLGALVIAPFLIRWFYRPVFIKSRAEVIEGLMLFSFLILGAVYIFWGQSGSTIGNVPLIYILFVPLIWAALRSGPRGMTLSIFFFTSIALLGTITGHGPFGGAPVGAALLLVQVFSGTIAVIFLLLTSIVEERKEATVSLKSHVDQLEDALSTIRSEDKAKTEFLATLAHELRNPLSPIMSALDIIERNTINPKNLGQFITIQNHIRMMVRLLDDLLDISRITQKNLALQKGVVDVADVVTQSVSTVEAFFKSRGHTLSVSLPSEPVKMVGDWVRIQQMVVNLLNNAAKYTDVGGTVELFVTQTDDTVTIRVKDNGMGISQDMIQKIFEPFVQAKNSPGVGTGLGIGLYLTRRLVELHGGMITVQSDGPGKGSEFIVTLPKGNPSEIPPEAAPRRRFGFTLKSPDKVKHSILVVDDNVAAAEGLGKLLELTGHQVTLAFNGAQAITSVDEKKPEIVILDIGLPDIDGYEVARRIRAKASDITLIALTGYGQEEDKRKAFESGFHHHLTKPVGIADVEEVLART